MFESYTNHFFKLLLLFIFSKAWEHRIALTSNWFLVVAVWAVILQWDIFSGLVPRIIITPTLKK